MRKELVMRFLGHYQILYSSRLGRCYVRRGEVVIWGVAGRQTTIVWQLFFLVLVPFSLPLFVSARILVEVRAEQLRQTWRARMLRVVEVDSDGGEPRRV